MKTNIKIKIRILLGIVGAFLISTLLWMFLPISKYYDNILLRVGIFVMIGSILWYGMRYRIFLGIVTGFLISYIFSLLFSPAKELSVLPVAIGGFIAGYIIRKNGWLYGIVVGVSNTFLVIYILLTIAIANMNSIEKGVIFWYNSTLDSLSWICGNSTFCMVYYFLKDYDFFISLIFGSICGYIGELFVTKRVKSFFQYPELKKHFFLIFPIMGIILVLLIYNQHIKNRVSAIERYKRLALEESVKKNYDKAIEYYKKALSETRKVLPENEYKYYRELGFVYYFHKNDYDNAIYYFEKAVKNWQYNHGTCRLDECYLWLGYAYHKKGKKKEAIKNLEIVEKVSISPIFKRMASREIQRILGIKKECPKMKEDISKMKKEIPKESPEVKKDTPGTYPLILVPEKKNNKSEVK